MSLVEIVHCMLCKIVSALKVIIATPTPTAVFLDMIVQVIAPHAPYPTKLVFIGLVSKQNVKLTSLIWLSDKKRKCMKVFE